jgi:hypothetical protein
MGKVNSGGGPWQVQCDVATLHVSLVHHACFVDSIGLDGVNHHILWLGTKIEDVAERGADSAKISRVTSLMLRTPVYLRRPHRPSSIISYDL